jgi:hypothetical protein
VLTLHLWPSILAGGGFDLFGSLGLLLGVCAGLMPSRAPILLTSAACSGSFGLHYLGLCSATGVAMCAISVVQSLAAARFGGTTQPASLKAVFCLSLLAALVLVVVTWNGWPSLCAGAGTLCATFARLQADAPAMRRLFVCASTCWAGHNLQLGSVFALSCYSLTLAALLTAIWRERNVWPSLSRLRAAGRSQFDVGTTIAGENALPRIGAAEVSA